MTFPNLPDGNFQSFSRLGNVPFFRGFSAQRRFMRAILWLLLCLCDKIQSSVMSNCIWQTGLGTKYDRPRPLADHGIIETLNLKIFVVKCFGGNKEPHSTFSLGIYREVQQDFTPEIEVFHMLFERFHTKNIKRSLKQHIKYFNFW